MGPSVMRQYLLRAINQKVTKDLSFTLFHAACFETRTYRQFSTFLLFTLLSSSLIIFHQDINVMYFKGLPVLCRGQFLFVLRLHPDDD